MKPDGEHCCDMEEIEIDPSELFCQLGMLIVEGRVPEPSAKGRVEGPHCPPALTDHVMHRHCQENNAKCQQAIQLRRQMLTLWKNRVPMCIEVLLYADCEYDSHSAGSSAEVTMPNSAQDTCVMLEQWVLHVLPKRPTENTVPPRMLMQALRSYLHFSQISAWLNQSRGSAPQNLVYRITPPGDFCTNNFSERPDVHTFPVTLTTKNTTIKITVNSLPRRPDIPRVVCKMGHSAEKTVREGSKSPELKQTRSSSISPTGTPTLAYAGARPKTLSVAPRNKTAIDKHNKVLDEPIHNTHDIPYLTSWHRQPRNSSMQTTMQKQQQLQQERECYQNRHKRIQVNHACDPLSCDLSLTNHMNPTASTMQRNIHQQTQYDGAKINNNIMTTISLKQQTSVKSMSTENTSCEKMKCKIPHSEDGHLNVPNLQAVESPKVLLTLKSPGQGYFSKLGNLSDSDRESSGSSPDLDRYLKSLSQQCEPLSPSQMQVYLSSLVSPRTATPSPPPGGATGSPISHRICGPLNQVGSNQINKTAITSANSETKPGSLKCSYPLVHHEKCQSEENGHYSKSKNDGLKIRDFDTKSNDYKHAGEGIHSQNSAQEFSNGKSVSNGSVSVTNGNTCVTNGNSSVTNGSISVTNGNDSISNGTSIPKTKKKKVPTATLR